MARIFKPNKRQSASKQPAHVTLQIDDLDHQGLGVCRSHHPVVFVEGGLPNEQCVVSVERNKGQVWHGQALQVSEPSLHRKTPFCPHSSQCGGCQTQHVESEFLLTARQQAIDTLLQRVAGISCVNWSAPLIGSAQGYRRKARLAIDHRHKPQFSVGFRGKGSKQVIPIQECAVLRPVLQNVLSELIASLRHLNFKKALGHVTLLEVQQRAQISLRVTQPLAEKDLHRLTEFAMRADTAVEVTCSNKPAVYLGPEWQTPEYQLDPSLRLQFDVDDFIQVNPEMNQAMITQAMDWLAIEPDDQVLDLFCGIGNFSLPLAKVAKQVTGIEGVKEMVQRAKHNASLNDLDNCRFLCTDLQQDDWLRHATVAQSNKLLLDPARAGAQQVVEKIQQLNVSTILYVSCNPATFARDAGILAKRGFSLQKLSLIDMFPGTAHSELMGLFLQDK